MKPPLTTPWGWTSHLVAAQPPPTDNACSCYWGQRSSHWPHHFHHYWKQKGWTKTDHRPRTRYRVLKHPSSVNQRMPLIYVQPYMYQIFKGLAYIHVVPRVCHRDAKPQNLSVDPLTHQVKLCDFRSVKVPINGEASISYMRSRYYWAP